MLWQYYFETNDNREIVGTHKIKNEGEYTKGLFDNISTKDLLMFECAPAEYYAYADLHERTSDRAKRVLVSYKKPIGYLNEKKELCFKPFLLCDVDFEKYSIIKPTFMSSLQSIVTKQTKCCMPEIKYSVRNIDNEEMPYVFPKEFDHKAIAVALHIKKETDESFVPLDENLLVEYSFKDMQYSLDFSKVNVPTEKCMIRVEFQHQRAIIEHPKIVFMFEPEEGTTE